MTLRDAIITQVDRLQWTPKDLYTLILSRAELTEVSFRHIIDYLAGRADMTGERIDSLLCVLGLTVKPE